ncbi:MAG: beta-ketoacyl-[acyl-carrier-protein] synthase family protein [Flavobacteriaceae bacterium]|nr:beta-ketoacyl-[acyl-carrier-protein] synthase family protein [Flavobacteriaceae bacterium]
MNRVVITGMGVCAPNGMGLEAFASALEQGQSGIRFLPELEELQFSCQIAGKPMLEEIDLNDYFTKVELKGLAANGLIYGMIAGMDAWRDADIIPETQERPDEETGVVFGTGLLGIDKLREAIYQVDAGNVKRLGSTAVAQTMASGISAYLGGKIGAGNWVSSNSSACSTGTEALLMGYDHIKAGKATRMLVGSCSDSGPYIWGGFDAMRILPRKYNERPESASRPMSATAAGFVPGSGAGALVLESYASAKARGARIYAEVLGGAVNSGGQRQGGSMTAPNSQAVQACIRKALKHSEVHPQQIDAINGHLTATTKDPVEIANWATALDRRGADFPHINSFKGHVGHCLAAAGSIESVGAVLQLHRQRLFGSLNCEDLHPDIVNQVAATCIPQKTMAMPLDIVAKASFGFGDVNSCVIFKRYIEKNE